MTDNAEQAPWIVMEPDTTDRRFIMVHNCYTHKTFRLRKKDVGTPLGAGVTGQTRNFLLAERMIVDPAKVTPMIEERIFDIMHSYPSNKAMAVFIPTHSCQLDCTYCFNVNVRKQGGQKRLPPEKIAAKLVKYFSASPAQMWTLKLTGGGEPTLVSGYILKVAKIVRQEAEKQGRFFEIFMITNGAALTKTMIDKFVRAGLMKMQITLDPDHDKTRVYKNGRGSLADIIENIKLIPMSVELAINSNLSPGDEAAFARLVKNMEPLRHRLVDFSPGPQMNKLPEVIHIEGKKKMVRFFGPKLIEMMIACNDMVTDAGFRQREKFPRVACETFTATEHLYLNYTGATSICPGLEAVPEFQSNGRSLEMLMREYDYRIAMPQWKEHCYEDGKPCAYLTKCFGGCRMISVIQGAGWGVINCEKPLFDKVTRHILSNA